MSWQFSQRTTWERNEIPFAAALLRARGSGRRIVDLTVSNPTVCGFDYDAKMTLAALGDGRSLQYDPDPRGMRVAREAVARYYGDHSAAVSADDLILTTSTSEAYSFVFRLLCDSGDEVLIARPSYPLFDLLAGLDEVRLRSYPLFYDHGWWIDFDLLERSIGPRTRAIVVVHPNNPTGHATGAAERLRLAEICARHRLALVVDEVFLDYPAEPGVSLASFTVGPHSVPTFVLSGLSKIAGLPQMKCGWIAVCGEPKQKKAALDRLEVIADTFLSVSAPIQLALPDWLAQRHAIQEQIRARVRGNRDVLAAASVSMLRMEAGWAGVLRLPQCGDDTAERLLEQGVIVHPGTFYGIAEHGRVVVSLIAPSADLLAGVAQIRAVCPG